MIGVYGWALARPERRIKYNFIITSLSVAVALLIAGIGVAGLLAEERSDAIPAATVASIDMTTLGCVVVFVFAAVWLIAVAASRFSFDRSTATLVRTVR